MGGREGGGKEEGKRERRKRRERKTGREEHSDRERGTGGTPYSAISLNLRELLFSLLKE